MSCLYKSQTQGSIRFCELSENLEATKATQDSNYLNATLDETVLGENHTLGQIQIPDLDESRVGLLNLQEEHAPSNLESKIPSVLSPENSKDQSTFSPLKPINVFPVVRKASQEKILNESSQQVLQTQDTAEQEKKISQADQTQEAIQTIHISDGAFKIVPIAVVNNPAPPNSPKNSSLNKTGNSTD